MSSFIASSSTVMPHVALLSREGCGVCETAWQTVKIVCSEFHLIPELIDVDKVAVAQPELRGKYGDMLPVVLIDGKEVSVWDVAETQLRRTLHHLLAGTLQCFQTDA